MLIYKNTISYTASFFETTAIFIRSEDPSLPTYEPVDDF